MSYILDALRKAEAQRQRGSVPGLHTPPLGEGPGPGATAAAGDRRWAKPALIVLGTLGLALLAALATGWRPGPAPTTASPGALALPGSQPVGGRAEADTGTSAGVSVPGALTATPGLAPPATAPVAAPVAAPITAPVTAPGTASVNLSGTSPVAATPPARSSPPAAAAPAEPASQATLVLGAALPGGAAVAPKPAAGGGATRPPQAPSLPGGTATPSTPSPTGAAPGATAASASAPTTASTEVRLYKAAELPPEIRQQLPSMTVGGAMHSENAASRMLILNGQLYREGDQPAPGLTLERIQLRSAVLVFKGWRYEIAY